MRPFACLIAAGMLAVTACAANAAPVAYGEAFDTLYRIDLTTHTATAVGAAGMYAGQTIGNISGLTTAPDGTLYAAAGGQKLLVTVNPASGAAQVVGSLGLAGQGDPGHNDALDLNMVASCDGTLWLSSAVAGKLWTVDPATGATSLVGVTGHTITGLVARGSVLYGAGGQGNNNFYRIDTHTGAATLIGSFGSQLTGWVDTVSMSFGADGTLWAVLNYVPPQNDSDPIATWSDLATINPDTGTVSIVGPITGPPSLSQVGIKGFTAGAAPCAGSEPMAAPTASAWSLTLLGGLLALVGLIDGRRRSRLRIR
jgi:hypothetical protein